MKHLNYIYLVLFFTCFFGYSQNPKLPEDYLSKNFHKERREALRKLLPKKSVAVFFSNAVRNRSNDVDYMYHQDPNFYYLTGHKEPNSLVLIFKEDQENGSATYNELIFVQERNDFEELWNGKRLGIVGVQDELGFRIVYNGRDFKNYDINFSNFDKILFEEFQNDVRDNPHDEADLYTLINQFKEKVSNDVLPVNSTTNNEIQFAVQNRIDTKSIKTFMGTLREIKTVEELVLLKKAVEISSIGQIEVMKAMHPNMSEREVQGVHEFVYKKYGAEYEGYPSIV